MQIHRRDFLLGSASLAALSVTGCGPLPTLIIAAGLGIGVTLLLAGQFGIAVSVESLMFDIVKGAAIGVGAEALKETIIKFADESAYPKPITKGDQIDAAIKKVAVQDDDAREVQRQFAYLAAQAHGEDDIIDALNNKTPIWLHSTSLEKYNSFKVLLSNNTNSDCALGVEGDQIGGQILFRIVDQQSGKVEASFWTDPFCMHPGGQAAFDYSFLGTFSQPGKKRLELVTGPAQVDVKFSREFLVVPLQAGDPFDEENAIRPTTQA